MMPGLCSSPRRCWLSEPTTLYTVQSDANVNTRCLVCKQTTPAPASTTALYWHVQHVQHVRMSHNQPLNKFQEHSCKDTCARFEPHCCSMLATDRDTLPWSLACFRTWQVWMSVGFAIVNCSSDTDNQAKHHGDQQAIAHGFHESRKSLAGPMRIPSRSSYFCKCMAADQHHSRLGARIDQVSLLELLLCFVVGTPSEGLTYMKQPFIC